MKTKQLNNPVTFKEFRLLCIDINDFDGSTIEPKYTRLKNGAYKYSLKKVYNSNAAIYWLNNQVSVKETSSITANKIELILEGYVRNNPIAIDCLWYGYERRECSTDDYAADETWYGMNLGYTQIFDLLDSNLPSDETRTKETIRKLLHVAA